MPESPDSTASDDPTNDNLDATSDEETEDEAPPDDGDPEKQLRRLGRVGRILLDRDPDADDDLDFDQEVVQAARRAKVMDEFGALVGRGVDLDLAAAATVRRLSDIRQQRAARAFALGLEPTLGAAFARVAMGQVMASTKDYDEAWEFLRGADVALLARLAPVETVSAGLKVGTPESVAVAEQIATYADDLDSDVLVELAGRYLVTAHQSLADDLVARVHDRGLDQLDDHSRAVLDNLAHWTHARPVHGAHNGVTLGVMDYHQVDYERASRNLGDYIQTLAMLGNLARFQEARFSGEAGVAELMSDLQASVKPELRLAGGAADVRLVSVSRDFSPGESVPEDTWLLAFGWHMHSTFKMGFGLPYHPNVHPIFVSFHVNLLGVLTPEAIDYLKAHGPIGCRDWTTVDILLSAGVDAFFSGCLTTTVDAVFPPTDEVAGNHPLLVAAVDIPDWQAKRIKYPMERITHMGHEHRTADLATGVRAAQGILDNYQRRYTRLVTSRLHSYLPATSLDLDVRFRPTVAGDVRFDGLRGLKPGRPGFNRIQRGIRELLAQTFALILDGAPPEQVYARWREITADRVENAKARQAKPPVLEAPDLDLVKAVDGVVVQHAGPAVDDATDVLIHLVPEHAERLPVTVESVLANASGRVRLNVLTRGLDPAYALRLSSLFPELPMRFLDFADVQYGDAGGPGIDCLLVPAVLPDVSRVVWLWPDVVVDGDVCALAETDLEGQPLAARSLPEPGPGLWRVAGDKLSGQAASELRRTMAARHPFGWTTFEPRVLVVDLDRLREDRFVEDEVPRMAGVYGLAADDVLHAYVGPRRRELDRRWNVLAGVEAVESPGIVNFALAGDPTEPGLLPDGDRWAHYAARIAEREAAQLTS